MLVMVSSSSDEELLLLSRDSNIIGSSCFSWSVSSGFKLKNVGILEYRFAFSLFLNTDTVVLIVAIVLVVVGQHLLQYTFMYFIFDIFYAICNTITGKFSSKHLI